MKTHLSIPSVRRRRPVRAGAVLLLGSVLVGSWLAAQAQEPCPPPPCPCPGGDPAPITCLAWPPLYKDAQGLGPVWDSSGTTFTYLWTFNLSCSCRSGTVNGCVTCFQAELDSFNPLTQTYLPVDWTAVTPRNGSGCNGFDSCTFPVYHSGWPSPYPTNQKQVILWGCGLDPRFGATCDNQGVRQLATVSFVVPTPPVGGP
jgi:hypothetical protein